MSPIRIEWWYTGIASPSVDFSIHSLAMCVTVACMSFPSECHLRLFFISQMRFSQKENAIHTHAATLWWTIVENDLFMSNKFHFIILSCKINCVVRACAMDVCMRSGQSSQFPAIHSHVYANGLCAHAMWWINVTSIENESFRVLQSSAQYVMVLLYVSSEIYRKMQTREEKKISCSLLVEKKGERTKIIVIRC